MAATYVELRAVPALDLAFCRQPMTARRSRDDIRDGVYGADLVEVDGFDRNVVNLGFRVSKKIECG